MSDSLQRIKLLRLMELLSSETDENHPLTTRALCARLAGMGIACDRRTLSRDIALIDAHFAPIASRVVRHEKAYYLETRPFDAAALRVLIDAVRAAAFIPEAEAVALCERLARLAGARRDELLRGAARRIEPRRGSGEVLRSIDLLSDAVAREKQLNFLYFDPDEARRRVYREGGARYIAEPLMTVFDSDRYYLLAWTLRHEGLTVFRVDRMEDVQITNLPLSPAAQAARAGAEDFIAHSFHMFGGEREEVELAFDRALLGAFFDHFDTDARLRTLPENLCCARVSVNIAPTFFAWVAQFGGRMRITAPPKVVEAYRALLRAGLDEG